MTRVQFHDSIFINFLLNYCFPENEDHAINLAELLARKLKDSRPFLDSISHNGARVMDQMPEVIDQVGERVKVFKKKMSGVFNKVLNTFQKVMGK